RKPRKNPAAAVPPPSSRMRNGAVGKSWKADTKMVKLSAHMARKCGVKSAGRSGPGRDTGTSTLTTAVCTRGGFRGLRLRGLRRRARGVVRHRLDVGDREDHGRDHVEGPADGPAEARVGGGGGRAPEHHEA